MQPPIWKGVRLCGSSHVERRASSTKTGQPSANSSRRRSDLFTKKTLVLPCSHCFRQLDLLTSTRGFSRLSLRVSDIDELSRAPLFVRGLSDELRPDAMCEHPKNLSQAIRAARTARRCSNLSPRRQRNAITAPNSSEISPRMDNQRKKLDQAEREQLNREGRCFKCRKDGHLSKDCSERNPNARRQ